MAVRDGAIAAMRNFNRFYTGVMDLLGGHILKSAYSLSEARVLYEIGHAACVASDLTARLGIDAGYLSRMIGKFERDGLVRRERLAEDGRAFALSLSPKGEAELGALEAASDEHVGKLLASLPEAQQRRLAHHMDAIRGLLAPERESGLRIRPFMLGDMSVVARLHAVVYGTEYGFDATFEGYVLKGMGAFLEDREGGEAWVVEDGEVVGSLAIVRADEKTAQLRWFLLLPEYRGLGLGRDLVRRGLAFCRERGYERVVLWTVADLVAARTLYMRAGFSLAERVEHDVWGRHLVEERWEMMLA